MAVFEFRLLGPLEVWCGGRQLAVGGHKPRAVLAMLLLRPGETVSADRLIDGLWGEHPPGNALNALQAHVAALRRALHPAREAASDGGPLITRQPGYALAIERDAVDTVRFERLLASGRDALPSDPVRATALLREALALWRGPALAEFVFEPFAGADAARLEELRLEALEARVDADLALGAGAEVVAELEALVAEHPLREHLAGQLMRALYRSGRQADACRVFHETRTALVEQLGMEPQPALRRLFQRVLEQDPALSAEPVDRRTRRAGAERAPHNLPAELTSFVGRERELDEVQALLGRCRLLTLTGAGGAGKTRLALRAARQLLDHYPDGVWLVELAPLSDPTLVGPSLAEALGIRERSGGLLEALERRLHDARLLVVLDNCEHLLSACAALAHELLRSCEQLRILATSRQPLGVAGEVTWRVPGLALPDAASWAPPDELGRYAAIRLFAERAAAARPDYSLEGDAAETVADLCRRLDGIPLAIELAAARTRALSAAEILRRLDDRFALLTGGARGALARQQTLRATIDWSHELLEPVERTLFRRLAVFAGGWRLAGAEQVCADAQLPEATVCDVLCELVAKSLVIADPTADGTTRYRMLETLRAYAEECLIAAGERGMFARRHLGHFLALAERAHEERQTRGLNAELRILNSEQDNIRGALAFAGTDDPARLLRLATACEQLWLAGHIAEGLRWLREALAATPEPTRARVRALTTATALETLQQAREEARLLVDEGLALAAAIGDKPGEAGARLWLGFLELNHDPPGYRELERSLAIHEEVGDRVGICHSLAFLGAGKSQYPATRQHGLEALTLAARMARELEDAWGEAFARIFLGWLEAADGDRELARAHFVRAVSTEALGPVRGTAFDGLASLAVEDAPDRAMRLLAAATSLRERDGGRPPAWVKRRGAAVRARAEELLDSHTAEQAWEEGLGMSTERAIAYALSAGLETRITA